MSQLLVTVFVTSDRHNLLISEDVSAVAKLGVSPTEMGKCETAEPQFLLAVLSPASFHPQKMKLRHKQGRHSCTLNGAQNHPAVR